MILSPRSSAFALTLGFLLVSSCSGCAGSRTTADSEPASGTPLALVLKEGLVGLSDHEKDAADSLLSDLQAKRGKTKSKKARPSKDSAATVRRVKTALLKADLDYLRQVSEGTLYRAMKLLPESQSLAAQATAALSAEDCPGSALLSAIGMRTERWFPESGAIELAAALYAKSLECGSDASAARAGYRLSLIKIWQGKWEEAEPLLSQVLQNAENDDYRSRALYWSHVAARKLGKSELQSETRNRILRDFPLSLQALLVSRETESSETTETGILAKTDPMVEFRSLIVTELNLPLAAAELALERNQPQLAVQALEPQMATLRHAERTVQLYVAVLLFRAGETIKKFQLITSLYREDPKIISRSTLEMLYPLHRFDLIKPHGDKIDPYLVISLIRQESAFNERARSPVGAMGLMQIMPATARRMERISKKQLMNPATNVRLGVRYFSNMINRYNGDVELALAAYNAGPHRVDEWMKRYPVDDRTLFLDLVPFKETRDYVASIARNYFWYQKLYDAESAEARRVPASDVSESSNHRFSVLNSVKF